MRVGQERQKPIEYVVQFMESKNLWQILFVILVCLGCIGILQDFIHSGINRYSFYIEESVLYKTGWLLFLPLLYLQSGILQTKKLSFFFQATGAILLPIAAHSFLTPLIIWFVSSTLYSHTYSYFKVLKYILAEDFNYLLTIYGLFLIGHLCSAKLKLSKAKTDGDVSYTSSDEDHYPELLPQIESLKKIVVANGRNFVSIQTDEILYFAAATPYIVIQTVDKRYLHSETLKSISESLDKSLFVRTHKSRIVNLAKVVSYKSRLNGDYDLLLENGEKIRLSRNYAENFKRLYASTPHVKQ